MVLSLHISEWKYTIQNAKQWLSDARRSTDSRAAPKFFETQSWFWILPVHWEEMRHEPGKVSIPEWNTLDRQTQSRGAVNAFIAFFIKTRERIAMFFLKIRLVCQFALNTTVPGLLGCFNREDTCQSNKIPSSMFVTNSHCNLARSYTKWSCCRLMTQYLDGTIYTQSCTYYHF